jgi:hypothetical protein
MVMATNTVARTLHDVGLATWFGGSLMGAVGVNGAAGAVDDPRQRARVASTGWSRWAPVQLGAIAAHGAGALALTRANRGRLASQADVAKTSLAKGTLTVAALAATGYSALLGQRMDKAGDVPVESGAVPTDRTPSDVADAQKQLRLLQWTVPALTGAVFVLNDVMAEQQRPTAAARGFVRRLVPGL